MATKTVEGFSISHAAILNGTTGLDETWGDIYGIREGSIEPDTDTYDNTGDDAVLSAWFWFNYATVTVTAGYVPFDLLAQLSGTVITSSGAAPNDFYNLPLWDDLSLNTPTRPMLIRVPSKDSAGVVRKLDIVLYKVQFEPFGFDGPSYKDGLLLNYTGKSLISSTDEKGTVLSSRAIGRLISRP
jgi:hypothetical protein